MINSTKPVSKISILGCGWFGLPLAKQLIASGYHVKGSTTSISKVQLLADAGIEAYRIVFEADQIEFNPAFFETELLIISIPPGRNSPTAVYYPEKIMAVANAAKKHGVKQVIFISSTGVYEDGNFEVDETVIPNPTSDSGKLICAAEKLLQGETAFCTTILRFAGLIGPGRFLTKHITGKTDVPNGLAPINLIHLTDCIGLTEMIISQLAFGKIYHGVSPHHPTRAKFYTKNCQAHHLAAPSFKSELLDWKKIESVKTPVLGYKYRIGNWDQWLQELGAQEKGL